MPPLFGEGLDRGRLWNAVLALQNVEIDLHPAPTSARFAPADPPAPGERCLEVAVRGVGQPLFAVVRDFPFAALFDVDLQVADLPNLPEALRTALDEGLRAVILSMLPADFARDLVVAGEEAVREHRAAGTAGEEWFALRLARQDGLAVDLLVGWPRRLIAECVARGVLGGAQVVVPVAEHLTLPAFVTLGAITVSLGELRQLESGAVVVLAEGVGPVPSVRVGEVVFAFAEAEHGLLCSGPVRLDRHRPRAAFPRQHRETVMEDEASGGGPSDPAGGEETGIALDELKVAVDFDLGRSMVPLAMLAAWQPATVVDIALPAMNEGVEVTIRVNGDVVGHGDLVRIDDRIAVRITRLSLRA